jgi:hypothetical protein
MEEPHRLSHVAENCSRSVQLTSQILNKHGAFGHQLLIYCLQHADINAHLAGLVCQAAVIVLRWCCVQRLGLAVSTLSVPGYDLTK